MSISNRHQFAPLGKNSKPFTGQRLARVIAKPTQGIYNDNLRESLCVSIPFIPVDTIRENINSLMPHLVDFVTDVQNSVIKELRIESGCSEISDDDIGMPAILKYLEGNSRGGRITTEFMLEWMRETYSVQAAEFIAIACKFGNDMDSWSEDQLTVIEQKSNVLFSMFAGFASGKYSPPIPLCRAMGRFGEFLEGSNIDGRMTVCLSRARSILETKESELNSDALGF